MPYTVKLPPSTSSKERAADTGDSPQPKEPVTAVTGGFVLGRGAPKNTHPGNVGPDPEAIAHVMGQPLDVFARQGQLLEVRVPYFAQTLWFVPGETDAETLAHEGISRGRVWTARELADLLSCAGLRPDQAEAVALAKIELGGDVVEVRHQ